jgi:hypothetical protein
MMNNMFNKCPACGGALVITECQCSDCGLQMQGQFLPAKFSLLSVEHLAFIEVFLRVRGNLSEAERVLGVSYPTIRNKLDEINAELDKINLALEAPSISQANTASQSDEEIRHDILRQVAAGTLTANEANIRLQKFKAANR